MRQKVVPLVCTLLVASFIIAFAWLAIKSGTANHRAILIENVQIAAQANMANNRLIIAFRCVRVTDQELRSPHFKSIEAFELYHKTRNQIERATMWDILRYHDQYLADLKRAQQMNEEVTDELDQILEKLMAVKLP